MPGWLPEMLGVPDSSTTKGSGTAYRFLTGKYREGMTPQGARLGESPRAGRVLTSENFARLERFRQFAEERHHSLVELAFGWLLSHAEVASVIASASSAEQVRQNVQPAAWRLDASEMEAVGGM